MALTHGHTGNHFLDSLEVGTFKLLSPSLVDVVLTRQDVISTPGSDIDCVWFPTTAVLSVITIMASGQDVEACIIGRESGYGLLSALGSPIAMDRVIPQAPGEALKMRSSRMKSAAALSADLTDLIIRHAQGHAAQLQQSVACNAIHSVEARLCRWLLMTQDRIGGAYLPLTQEFLGFMLGVQRTTVTGFAGDLQDAGAIRYSRGQIEILNRKALEAGACECYAGVERNAKLLGISPLHTAAPRNLAPSIVSAA